MHAELRLHLYDLGERSHVVLRMGISYLGTPITAASAIAGWPSNNASSSAGATWKPLTLISS